MRYFYLILSLIITIKPLQTITRGELYGNIFPGGVITAAIDSPIAGQDVQGAVVVRGSTAVERFQYYEIDYSSTADPAHTWFMIQQSSIPIQDGVLAVWDTSSITDGNYDLRMLVFKTDGSRSEVPVLGLRLLNYASLGGSTPSPAVMYVTLGPPTPTTMPVERNPTSFSVTPLSFTPTPLPVNPAEITSSQVMSTFGRGAALSIGLLALLGAYVGIRAYLNGRK
jgi:hypothetical protein